MPHKIREILFVSSPYDAFIMEEDGALMDDVIRSYKGVGLSQPARFTVVPTAEDALEMLQTRQFDLVVTMPRFFGMDAITLGKRIKEIQHDITVVMLVHNIKSLSSVGSSIPPNSIDKVFTWTGNRSILMAIIKWAEDRKNVDHDTQLSMVRVIIVVEDSAYYYSSFLPLLYDAVMKQTQKNIDDSLNDEHRLLKLRARTKILLAENYEEGMVLYMKYNACTMAILSDIRYERNDEIDAEAGFHLIENVKKDNANLPVLLMSTETHNREKAYRRGVNFLDKNSPTLHHELKKFLVQHLGFGDFIFRTPDGEEVARVTNLRGMERTLQKVEQGTFEYHLINGHFVNWFMARSEVFLASRITDMMSKNEDSEKIRKKLVSYIHEKRVQKKRGIVTTFDANSFEDEFDFVRHGEGSLGGKARGLAFMSRYLVENARKFSKFKKINLSIPKTLVLTSDAYDNFLDYNELNNFLDYNKLVNFVSSSKCNDEEIANQFVNAKLPDDLANDLRVYLLKSTVPIAVRSSGLLEDSKYQPFAGLYHTYMLPNNHSDIEVRLDQLAKAIKLVFASVYFAGPQAFARTTMNRTEEEKMAVVIQHVVGEQYGDYFYPSVSGVAQSYNYYPVQHLEQEDGIIQMGLGFGRIVVEGGKFIRFSPKYPQFLPQFSDAKDMVRNSQKYFYALKIKNESRDLLIADEDRNLARREVFDCVGEFPVKIVSSEYFGNDDIIREGFSNKGAPVVLFSKLLKFNQYDLPDFFSKLLQVAQEGLGCEVEIEFAFNIPKSSDEPLDFYLLQVRPMVAGENSGAIIIDEEEKDDALCYSTQCLGQGELELTDIIYVQWDKFDIRNTVNIASEISKFNSKFEALGRKFLLVGPGRWGSSDPALGIPVSWSDISEVGAIVEAMTEDFKPDPSQGTHFFHNLTSLGIPYYTVYSSEDFLDQDLLDSMLVKERGEYVSHVELERPLILKVAGRTNEGIIKLAE